MLGVGPHPDGTLSELQISRLKEIGDWLKVNGAAIYGTRATTVYTDNTNFFTKGKKGETYAIVPLKENEPIPSEITWSENIPAKGTTITLLMNGKKVKWEKTADGVKVILPAEVKKLKSYPALAFRFTSQEKN